MSEKTIQRDIDDLRIYLADTHFSDGKVSIEYDRTRCGYYLIWMEREYFTNEEVLFTCKVLLESRAFCKDELDPLLTKLLMQVTPTDGKRVRFMYPGELRKVNFEYSGPSVEAVLDRLPTAESSSSKNGVYTVSTEVYGNGSTQKIEDIMLIQ